MERLLVMVALFMLALTNCTALAEGLPDSRIPNGLGVNIHFTAGQEKQVEQIAKAGFKLVRMDFFWHDIEKTKGEYDFSSYDALVADLDKHGIRPVFILDYGNGFYSGGRAPHNDESRAAFIRFVKAGAAHFKGRGIIWELWNEPNLDKFWQPTASAEDYVKLAKAVYPAVKEADPGCTLMGPALGGWDYAYLEHIFSLGVLDYLDVVSIHPYGANKPEDASELFAQVRRLIAKYAPYKRKMPVVSGEWGFSAFKKGVSEETQGYYLPRMFLSNLMNDIPLSIWYDWHDDGTDPEEVEHHFGTVYRDFSPKPSYKAMQTLARELKGYTYAVRTYTKSPKDYLVLFRSGDQVKMAAWTTDQPHTVNIPLDVAEVAVTSFIGESKTLRTEKGKLKLELSQGVQYMTPTEPSKRWLTETEWQTDAEVKISNGQYRVFVASQMPEASGTLDVLLQRGKNKLAVGGEAQLKVAVVDVPSYGIGTGGRNARLKLEVKRPQDAEPFVRMLEVDASVLPALDILPPADNMLFISVNRGEYRAGSDFKGRVVIGNSQGLALEEDVREFVIPADDKEILVAFPMLQQPASMFSFACNLEDAQGNVLLKLPARQYFVVETFADGQVDSTVTKYSIELDGSPDVKGEAKLTYTETPVGGPGRVCAKLNYGFDSGWKFVRVASHPMIGIYGEPIEAKLWVKADNKNAALRLRFVGSDNQVFQPDYGWMNYGEWRCLSAQMKDGSKMGHWAGKNDGIIRYPIKWDTLVLFDSTGKQMNGEIYLGPLMLCYD